MLTSTHLKSNKKLKIKIQYKLYIINPYTLYKHIYYFKNSVVNLHDDIGPYKI